MTIYKRFLKIILAFGVLFSTLTLEISAAEYSVTRRIYGDTRVETSIEVSKNFYADRSSPNVVLAGFNGEVDALTGTLLASSLNAPMLLVDQYKSIKNELIRLGAFNIYLLGGETVISRAIEKDLQMAGYEVIRVSGDNRWQTSVAIANEAVGMADHVFLANDGISGSLVDALAIGPVSGMYLSPILLTGKDSLPSETLNAMKNMNVKTVKIVGGTSVVSEKIEQKLGSEGFTVERVAGENRWETADLIADFYFQPGAIIVANDGYKNPLADALMSGHIGAKMNIPLLLTGKNSLNNLTKKQLLKSSHLRYVLGGTSAISEKTFQEIIKTEGEVIQVDTEKQIIPAHYDVIYNDKIPEGKEVIAEFARNGTQETTYKAIVVGGKRIDDIPVSSKTIAPPQNGLIFLGARNNLEEPEPGLIPTYSQFFAQSGWTGQDFITRNGRVEGFSDSGKKKATHEFEGLALVIPEKDSNGTKIHTVGKEAFKGYYFQRVKMPDTITRIDDGAFESMSLLYTEFPTQLKTVGKKAFSNNGFSYRVNFDSLPDLTEIGDEAFNFAFSSDQFQRLNLFPLYSLTLIGKGAFVGNTLISVVLPESLISIDSDAFYYNSIDQVYIPYSVEYLSELAFDDGVILKGKTNF